jgi:hypothetical protein
MRGPFFMENKVGRPPAFADVTELEEAINDYFQNGVTIRKVVVGKAPNQQVVAVPVPTITGLCYHIGFESRQSFYDYEEKPEFTYTVKRARLFIEKEYEEQLSIGNTVGAIFALKNMGWKDKTEQDLSVSGGLGITWQEQKTYETELR